VWAGRSLTRVLATCSGAAWGLTARESKAKLLSVLSLTAVLFTAIAAGSFFTRLRESSGPVESIAVFVVAVATMTVVWFLVTLTLPKATPDPSALLPGAVVVGIGYTALQWFMQYYLPNKVARTSDTFGELAKTVATLGNFFFIGRLLASSLVLNAVVYEVHGSLSHLVFDLPGLRRLPKRYPSITRYFDLDHQTAQAAAESEPEE